MSPFLRKSGYRPCACFDCFEIAIGDPGALCLDCQEAGCVPFEHQECKAPGAYGVKPSEPEDGDLSK